MVLYLSITISLTVPLLVRWLHGPMVIILDPNASRVQILANAFPVLLCLLQSKINIQYIMLTQHTHSCTLQFISLHTLHMMINMSGCISVTKLLSRIDQDQLITTLIRMDPK